MDALRRAGARSVEREGERVVALFPPPAPARVEALVAAVCRRIRSSTDLSDPAPLWRWVTHEAWAERWRQDVPTRHVTRRIAVTGADGPPATLPEPRPEILIRLHPALAFGTAEHPTTRACLTYLDRHLAAESPARVLDVGAGTGVLAMAAVLLGAARALAVEADPVAFAGLRANLAANGVTDRVEALEGEASTGYLRRLGRFELVVANLQATILLPLVPPLAAAVAPGGRLLLSGLIDPEGPSAADAARTAGLEPEWASSLEGWWTGAFRRPAG